MKKLATILAPIFVALSLLLVSCGEVVEESSAVSQETLIQNGYQALCQSEGNLPKIDVSPVKWGSVYSYSISGKGDVFGLENVSNQDRYFCVTESGQVNQMQAVNNSYEYLCPDDLFKNADRPQTIWGITPKEECYLIWYATPEDVHQ